jgi:hypothetical protein
VSAPDKRTAMRRALDIVKFNEREVEWGPPLPFSSLGIRTEIAA